MAWSYPTKNTISSGESWVSILTTWATETRTWEETSATNPYQTKHTGVYTSQTKNTSS